MGTDGLPEWLPNGWIMQIKKIDSRIAKCYLDPKGNKFYSKPQVFRHLKTINNNNTHNAGGPTRDISLEPDIPHINEIPAALPWRESTEASTRRRSKKSKGTVGIVTGDGSSSEPDASHKKDGVSEWLPDGWITEVKTPECGSHIKRKYKYYMDPNSGRKFFSKPQVLKYLAETKSSVAGQKKGDNSSAEPDKSKKSKATDVKNTKAKKKTRRFHKFFDGEVISRTPADGLPPGWIKEIRSRKHASPKKKDPVKKDPYYLDPLSGYIFLSKLDALRYLDTRDIKKCAIKPLERDMNEVDNHNTDLDGGKLALQPDLSKGNETPQVLPNGCVAVLETKESGTKDKNKVLCLTGDGSSSKPGATPKDEVSKWLPDGWTVEVMVRDSGTRIGMRYKCFTDPISGRKFFSKPQVLKYLAGANSSTATKRKGDRSSVKPDSSRNSEATDVRRHNKSKKKKKNIRKSTYSEVISTSPAGGLPPGWIKETRTRKFATHERKDPYYTDPLSGYTFRSKLDALRYLETGDVNQCAIKPTKRDIDGKETSEAALDGENPVNSTTRKLVFADEEAENSMGKQLDIELVHIDEEAENSMGKQLDIELVHIDEEAENSMGKQPTDVSTDAAGPTTQILEENQIGEDCTDPKAAENTSVSTPVSARVTKIPRKKSTKRSKSSATLPCRSSKRLKAQKPETKSDPLLNEQASQAPSSGLPMQSEGQPDTKRNDSNGHLEDGVAVQEKQARGGNVEKQTDDMGESQLSYELDDSTWTDQCLDFAVKTLTGEIPVDVSPISEPFGAEADREDPTKVD